MDKTEKLIAELFDKTMQGFGIMVKILCESIEKSKHSGRIIIYKDMECELIGTSDGGGTLNTGGLAFCIKLPDGSIKNVQDTDCIFK